MTPQPKLAQAAVHASHGFTFPGPPLQTVACEGWVLKKRRKRMQGFARRYFTLSTNGVLSYSFTQNGETRDQIALTNAAVTTQPGTRNIHVDSEMATFHIKCLTVEDFMMWHNAFRHFIAVSTETRKSMSASVRGVMPRNNQINVTSGLVDEMGTTIHEIEEALAHLELEIAPKKRHSVSRSREKEKHPHKEGGSVFGIFKRPGPQKEAANTLEVPIEGIPSPESSSGSLSTAASPLLRVQAALDFLKSQHGALVKSLVHASPLPSTAEEPSGSRPPSRFAPSRASRRTSVATSSMSTEGDWFDADEGEFPEEFFMDEELNQAETLPGSRLMGSGQGADSSGSRSSLEESDDEKPLQQSSLPERPVVSRRTQLAMGPIGDEGSLFAMLKKNVGKDLSSVAFPCTFNEPLSLLQRAAEEVEYFDLLNLAVSATDPVERLCYVAAFSVSSYAHTRHRTGRKGFNPMLAETFEDERMKFIAEKVVHNPLVMAYHAEGNGWELHCTSAGKTKFWGKSLEVQPLGNTRVVIGDDVFEWNKPSSFMRNLVMGTKYLEHIGKTSVENKTTGARVTIEFKQSGYFGPPNMISGTVHSPTGAVVTSLEGKWDEQVAQSLDESHLRVLWRATPYPRNATEFYGFPHYGITLNEITPDMQGKLPPTDSRYRPDVRALENGDLDLAEEEKARVEEMQRERRKDGREIEPRWFEQIGDEWVYKGGYWEQREKGWDIEPLW